MSCGRGRPAYYARAVVDVLRMGGRRRAKEVENTAKGTAGRRTGADMSRGSRAHAHQEEVKENEFREGRNNNLKTMNTGLISNCRIIRKRRTNERGDVTRGAG